jgi:DnaK suppressor protein
MTGNPATIAWSYFATSFVSAFCDWHGACITTAHAAMDRGNGDRMQTQEMKSKLDAKLSELASRRYSREDIAIEKNAEEMDAIQRGSDRVLALDSITRIWETSTLVTEALRRIESNTYGVCLECEEAISPKRLAALPWAKYCITCQDEKDRENAELWSA